LLFKEGLSGYREERILIQLDTEPQHFALKPDLYLFNRFDIFTQIQTTPPDLLLAQKFYAILNRVRNKGRDFYDAVFLLGRQVRPNYAYLTQKRGIETPADLQRNCWLTARPLTCRPWPTIYAPSCSIPGRTV